MHYIIRAEYHIEDVFAIKFYCKKDRKSPFKYNKILNKHTYGTVIKIFHTCLSLVPILLKKHPKCNFAIYSARSVDLKNPKRLTEDILINQRFRIYTPFIQQRIGSETFTHFKYDAISSYLLVNNQVGNVDIKENQIKTMFERTYQSLPDISGI